MDTVEWVFLVSFLALAGALMLGVAVWWIHINTPKPVTVYGTGTDQELLDGWTTIAAVQHQEAAGRQQEQQKINRICKGCDGSSCWDWLREGRSCQWEPTRAPEIVSYLVGRHYHHTVEKAVAGWWPSPKSRAARLRPDLWAKAAGHMKIGTYTGRRFALP